MQTHEQGLSALQVQKNQRQFGKNELALHRISVGAVLLRQFNNPLLIILAVTTVVSYLFNDEINAIIIFGILALSIGIGFINEYSSEKTITDLLKKVSLSALVIRNGIKQDIPVSEVTMGDIVLLHQGTVVPADLQLIEAQGLAVDESSLTGEAMPALKRMRVGNEDSGRMFMGTVVTAGSGKGEVVAIGHDSECGRLAEGVSEIREKSQFQKGLAQLGSLMTKIIIVMAVVICGLNIALGRSPLESILFALAVAIGLTPALLPVIVTVSMAHGAHRMAKRKVVVKRLVSIEDLGNMEVLCTDKTGTLTEGKINLVHYFSMNDTDDVTVLEKAMLCNTASHHHRLVGNPIDVAIWEYALHHRIKLQSHYKKIAEEEFSYDNHGQFTVVEQGKERYIIFKGSADSVLERSFSFTDETGQVIPIHEHRSRLREHFKKLNREGLRLVVVAEKVVSKKEHYAIEDANHLHLLGYLTFLDVPKHSAKHAIDTLCGLGVEVKILTGDNELVTQKICDTIGVKVKGVLTGAAITRMSLHELEQAVLHTTVFARITPEQKAQIVKALKHGGRTVGFMGDGINDAAALHAADVSLSVNTAVDVAKDLASIVLLQKGLDVIAEGVKEGRRVFANTIKYILMGTSSNFGNMFSVAGASFFLPFLPMTPSQILLNNSLYDLGQLGIPGDEVDVETLQQPHRWNIHYIYRYMLFFGPISSIFDYLSFAIFWFGFHASASQFQTGWFLESIATQVLVVFVIRTSRSPFWKSRPSYELLVACLGVLIIAFMIPFSPIASYLHLTPLPPFYFAALISLIIGYVVIVEFVKDHFLRKLAM